jgi:hypothetical protein
MNTPNRLEAWVLRRIICSMPLNGELDSMGEPWRSLATKLVETPTDRHGDVLEGFLTGRPEANAVIEAVADANPMGPPPDPEADAEPDDGWGPVRFRTLPPVEPFPVDVLPPLVAELAIETARAIGCARDFPGMVMLAVAAGAIGRSVSLRLKPNYFVGPSLYVGCIGPPSDGKTPALKVVAAAVRAIDDELAAEHAAAMEKWKANQTGPDGKPIKKPPPPPKPRRIDIDDFTMEVLPMILEDNPRGLIAIRDELTAFILGMNQYKQGKGNDRSNALKIWSGDRIIKDRVNRENNAPVRCAHPALTIVGGLTPDMLGELLDPRGRADGFIDRFLLAYPDPLPVPNWSDRGISEDLADEWRSLIARLWERPLDLKDGQSVPHVAYFSPDGKARWEERYNAHSAEMNADDFPPFLRGPWGKLREYAGRLTLTVTLMRHASDPTSDSLAVPEVDAVNVDATWKLISYFKSHIRRIHAAIAEGPATSEARAVKAILEWIQSKHLITFTESEIRQARRWIKDDDLNNALSHLANCNAIRAHPAPQANPKGGRPPSPAYEVNPEMSPRKSYQKP